MHCPSCGFENPEGLKFCNECGAPLRMPCAQCGFANQPQAKFCGECGAVLPPRARPSTALPLAPHPQESLRYTPAHLAEKILQSKAALEGERKQVTVLFADLKGSMELLADRDPEEARTLLDPVLERMMEAVHHYEGTVNQVLGDGIMALFGAPIAHEDYAVRACYAALAMQEAMRLYSEAARRAHGITVQIRVGLNSGEVVVRAIGNDLHMDYSAIGQTTHLAARMEQLATPESILLTAKTLQLAEGFIQVQAVLAARIDRLPAEEKHLLQTAAAIGHEIPWRLLQAIAGLPETALHRSLAHLRVAELLYETTLFPELEYTFKHVLTHEVAYGSLLQERRRALHARIVETIEHLYPERLAEQVERLAHHALRSEVWDKAVAYCRQAGGKATDRSAYQEAAAYLEQALEALPHLSEDRSTREQAIDIRLNLRVVLFPLGGLQRALDHLREAETVADLLNDQRRLGQVLASTITGWWLMGAPARAVEDGERAHTIAAALGDVVLQRRSTLSLGQAYVTMGDYRRAADHLSRTMQAPQGDLLSPRFGSTVIPTIMSRARLAWSLAELGAFAEGMAPGAEAIQMAEAAGHPYSLITACYGFGLLHLRRGDLAKAIPVLEHGLDVCNAWGFHTLSFHGVAAFLGAAYVLAGRVTEALPLLERVVEQTDAMRDIFDHVLGVIPLGEGYLWAGRIDDALRQAQHAVEVCRQHQQRGHLAWALRLLGEVAVQYDPSQLEHAADDYRQALALAEALGMRPFQAHCHLCLGKLDVQTGRHDAARVELTAAIELYRSMEMTFWLPEAEAALAQVEGR